MIRIAACFLFTLLTKAILLHQRWVLSAWTKEIWFYDYRTNIHHTLKKNPLKLDNLPDPDELALEIVENLESALGSFREVVRVLGK